MDSAASRYVRVAGTTAYGVQRERGIKLRAFGEPTEMQSARGSCVPLASGLRLLPRRCSFFADRGNGSAPAGVASVGSATTTIPAMSQTASSTDYAKDVAYSQCVRSLGVPGFPDPNAEGDFLIDARTARSGIYNKANKRPRTRRASRLNLALTAGSGARRANAGCHTPDELG